MTKTISHKLLAEVLEIAADGIICMDASQRITYFNQGAQQIFGWTADEIVGQHMAALIPERFRQLHGRELADFARSGFSARRVPERREISGLRKNGEEFPAEAAISQLHGQRSSRRWEWDRTSSGSSRSTASAGWILMRSGARSNH